MGIPLAELPYIFDRFYQASASRQPGTGGSGIGLSLVRELVNLMLGTVTVESTVGKGTRFIVRLPVSRMAPLPARPLVDTDVNTLAEVTFEDEALPAGGLFA